MRNMNWEVIKRESSKHKDVRDQYIYTGDIVEYYENDKEYIVTPRRVNYKQERKLAICERINGLYFLVHYDHMVATLIQVLSDRTVIISDLDKASPSLIMEVYAYRLDFFLEYLPIYTNQS